MKKKSKKDIFILLILFGTLIYVTLIFSGKSKSLGGDYSILNKEHKGLSVIYETLKNLDYPVKFKNNNLENVPTDNIHVITMPKRKFSLEDGKIKNWIKDGGKIVYLGDDSLQSLHYGNEIKSTEDFLVYEYGQGFVLIGRAEVFTNKYLLENKEKAYEIITYVDRWSYVNIIFNEYYNYMDSERYSLWEDLPVGIRIMLQQLVIVIVLFFIYKGSRFGKIRPLYEETQRDKDEYLKAVSSLYKRGDCKEEVIKIYYEDLEFNVKKTFKTIGSKKSWIETWNEKNIENYNRAKRVHEIYSNINDKKISNKEFTNIIRDMEKLKKTLEKRSESYWKDILKEPQKKQQIK
ncbi:hypothetical protein [Anaeromicrobium sediminis]|uniref:DUF4350 domain-containing protein n=1 Tax=Anaeromicrobium sediminis TaxID=1478221 RepID=A0A267MLJ5_9FIRM|nr:hypothetical protein [Anaeromicrobium sediminis]PAB59673.1 hypothetical protein CCE28_08895 [Anaeromicrobium sediminis]